MNIQKIITLVTLSAGLAVAGISAVQANDRVARYNYNGDQRHYVQDIRQLRTERHERRDKRRARKARHDTNDYRRAERREHRREQKRERRHNYAQNAYVNRALAHKYKHKNGIPHRHAASFSVPHKSWRKQHKRWDYARYQPQGHGSSLRVQFSSSTPHNSRYIY